MLLSVALAKYTAETVLSDKAQGPGRNVARASPVFSVAPLRDRTTPRERGVKDRDRERESTNVVAPLRGGGD